MARVSLDFGINFETAFVARLNESGYTNDNGSDETAIEIIGYGTERGGFIGRQSFRCDDARRLML